MEKRKVRLISFILCVFLLAGTFAFVSSVNLRDEAVDISAESSSVIIMESVGSDNLAVTNNSFIRFSDTEVYYNMPLGYEAIFANHLPTICMVNMVLPQTHTQQILHYRFQQHRQD